MEKNTQMEPRKGRRLVLFPLPLQGHLNPMLELANILHSKGFSITILHTTFNSPDSSKHPHLTFHSIPDGISDTEASTNNVLSLICNLNKTCTEPFKVSLSALISDASDEPVSCLISDAIFHFTQAVADELKLPRIVLRTSGISSFLALAAYPLLREKGYLPIQESQLEEKIVELPPLRVKDLPVINTDKPENLYYLVDEMVNKMKVSAGVIWNSYEDLEETALATLRQEFGFTSFPIGPFHKLLPNPTSFSGSLIQEDSISWLEKQGPKSVIYVSFGSIAAISETKFLEIAWGLANCNRPFLWVVRPRSVQGSEWLEALPGDFLESLGGRGHIVKWASQIHVLSHSAVGAFWTHCGWNSTLESISEGVPMICTPCFTDQKVNARYVSYVWGLGVQLEKLERDEIARSIKRIMVEKEGEEIRGRILIMKEKAALSLKKGGFSYQTLERLVHHILSF